MSSVSWSEKQIKNEKKKPKKTTVNGKLTVNGDYLMMTYYTLCFVTFSGVVMAVGGAFGKVKESAQPEADFGGNPGRESGKAERGMKIRSINN
jgi:hypothetical protein